MTKQIVENDIVILSEREQIRNKISVWHGSSLNHNANIKELIGNSQDEILKGNGSKIKITMLNDNLIIFEDNCQGLPVEGTTINSKGDKIDNYIALFEMTFAGTKYNAFENEEYSVGTNGVFLATLSASSKHIKYEISRPNGKMYTVEYSKGHRVSDMKSKVCNKNTFTKITFGLDDEVWENPIFKFEEICDIAKYQACLTNCEIEVEHKPTNKKNIYNYNDGIVEVMKEFDQNDILRISKLFNFNTTRNKKQLTDKIELDMVFNITDSDSLLQREFLNGADLIHHGTIQKGIIKGVKESFHNYITNNKMYKNKNQKLEDNDISIGLNYICNFKSLLAEFENQTKMATQTKHYIKAMNDAISDFLNVYFIENKTKTEVLCKRLLSNAEARTSSEKIRADIKKKLQLSNNTTKTIKIEGLKDCDIKNSKVEERIALSVEGISASSTVEESIDPRIMGIITLRGRFINSLKTTVNKVLNNVPAYTMIQALGCGIEIPSKNRNKFKDIKSFNINNLRYGKIGLLSDSDSFGSNINLSQLTFLYKYMPQVVKEGRVYLVKTPRYSINLNNSKKRLYAYNLKEKEKIVKKLEKSNKKYSVGIIKGLGLVK